MRKGSRWALTGASLLVAFVGGAATSRLGHAEGERDSPYAPLAQLARALVLIENEYVDPVERQRMLDGAVKGLVAELDPHSAYMSQSEFALFNQDTEGSFGGIGVEVDFSGERVVVMVPMPGAPAQKAGIRAGDEIVAVDDKLVKGMSPDAIVKTMRGPAGTRVKLAVLPKGASTLKSFELTREHIHVRSVESKRLEGDVAYVRLRQFQEGTHDELLEEVGKLREASERPLRGVVLDLRNNPGGLVDEAEAVADELLASGVIYTTRHRGKILDESRAKPGGALAKLPVVVLVNELSASSSELVAGALRDNGRASVVGATTFGKGSVQTIFQLPGGAGMRLTTMRYYPPSGRAIQAAGVAPDVRVRYRDDETAALSLFREERLDGHLAPEASGPLTTVTEEHVGEKRPEYIAIDELPTTPSEASDLGLAVGYRKLLAKLEGASATAALAPRGAGERPKTAGN